ncbi:MAG: DUF2232 domain-containing protein [candidate division Zixibacteria bacterium]|nr:DUF2232 domain-containing protein [candidate division Zixibacteria bacterium]
MNRSVDELTSPTEQMESGEVVSRVSHWPILIALVLYPLVRFLLFNNSTEIGLVFFGQSAAYVIGTYLFYGIPLIVWDNRLLWVLSVGALSVALSAIVVGQEGMISALAASGMIVIAGVVAGRLYAAGWTRTGTYIGGLVIVALCSLVWLAPQWTKLTEAMKGMSEGMILDIKAGLLTSGYTMDAANGMVKQMQSISSIGIRLLPATTVLSAVAQYSLGFFLFLMRAPRAATERSVPQSITFVRVPFWVMPLLIIAISVRLLAGEPLVTAADNLLAILAVFYSVAGLALTEFFMRMFRFAWYLKFGFYVMMFFSGLIGFLMASLVGLIDSFADWRGRITTNTGLKE